MKKRSVLALLLALLLCFSLVLTGCKDGSDAGSNPEEKTPQTPVAQLTYSADKTVGAVLNSGMASSVFEDALKKGKITVEYQDILENILYIDSSNTYIADFLKLDLDGQEIEGEVYLKKGVLAVLLPEFLGEDALGLDLNTFAEDLENSPIWNLLGVSYEDLVDVYELDVDKLMDALLTSVDTVAALETAVKEASKDVQISSEEKKVTVGGEEVDAIVVTVKLTSADVEKMVLSYMDWLKDNSTDILDKVNDAIGSVDLNDMVNIEDSYDQYIDDIKDAFGDIDLTFDCVVNINADTEYMMTMDVNVSGKVDGEEGALRMNLDLGKDPSKSNAYKMTIVGESDGEVQGQIDLSLTKTTNGTTTETKLEVTMTEDGETENVFAASLGYDSASSQYTLNLEMDGETVQITGTFQYTEKVFELSVEGISTSQGDVSTLEGLLVRIEAVDQIPDMPAFKNILKMTEDELTELLTILQ